MKTQKEKKISRQMNSKVSTVGQTTMHNYKIELKLRLLDDDELDDDDETVCSSR